jgi:hypothetical protein
MLAVVLAWLTFDNLDTLPEWWSFIALCGVISCVAGALKFFQLHNYYEGPRTRIVVPHESPRQAIASRTNRR